ncbi:hypothetical protein CWM57_12345 [Klebsiella sp. G-Nf4]|nr:hypothetical protein CWM58_18585 [Klebsiella sp. H-Nf2]PJR55730.1 hypothetical protein CWM64_12435 [Klebsiella sp. I-Nf8]PJR60250.1 hypothetical protein CWM61_23265 [Klebsiella sp. K-Nf6]PJX30130.1 hypothetical protein CWM53_22280 [Klebsiella sp. A-Nf5]PJX37916.1 hypothetical protein CWM59_09855 [Klebsiella sp. B-Nf7]PJX42017.1 hypothetical protein CWM62_17150 [Klebsiella sp. C-Nf10]PJX50139.1 hypothetical protein CWM60_03830 [Klebsiella sp. C1-16S-Nf17]PJX55773.1 hypothetical protein CWM
MASNAARAASLSLRIFEHLHHLISSSHTVSLTEAPLPPALLNATSGKWLGSQQKGRPGSAQAV